MHRTQLRRGQTHRDADRDRDPPRAGLPEATAHPALPARGSPTTNSPGKSVGGSLRRWEEPAPQSHIQGLTGQEVSVHLL